MPAIPAEQKGAVTGHIAPKVLFFFRWAAALTVLTGLSIAFHNGYGAQALSFGGTGADGIDLIGTGMRSEEHTSELQSLMRISYAVFCLKKKKKQNKNET